MGAAEATQESASDGLKRIARWWTEQKKEKTNKAKGAGAGLPKNAPEKNWKLPGTPAASSGEWLKVSPRTPSSRASSPRRRKAGESEQDMIKEELAALQERMAKLQQMASKEDKGDAAKKRKDATQTSASTRPSRWDEKPGESPKRG